MGDTATATAHPNQVLLERLANHFPHEIEKIGGFDLERLCLSLC